MKSLLGRSLFLSLVVLSLSVGNAFAAAKKADAHSEAAQEEKISGIRSGWHLANVDVFANGIWVTDSARDGSSYGGGAHWAPTYGFNDKIDIKGYLGGHGFKDLKTRFALDFGALVRHQTFEKFLLQAGFGGRALYLEKTHLVMVATVGTNYVPQKEIFGLIDRINLDLNFAFGRTEVVNTLGANLGVGIDF